MTEAYAVPRRSPPRRSAPKRVTLNADVALVAFAALRSSLESLKEDQLECQRLGEEDWTARYFPERWAAYERMAKALGLQPTISPPRGKPCIS